MNKYYDGAARLVMRVRRSRLERLVKSGGRRLPLAIGDDQEGCHPLRGEGIGRTKCAGNRRERRKGVKFLKEGKKVDKRRDGEGKEWNRRWIGDGDEVAHQQRGGSYFFFFSLCCCARGQPSWRGKRPDKGGRGNIKRVGAWAEVVIW